MPAAIRRFAPDPFILSLFAAILVASLLPAKGEAARIVDIVTTAAIVLLFFLHGVRLERSAVIAALTHWPLHLVILGSTFVLFPLLGLGLHAALRPTMPEQLWLGVLFLCALSVSGAVFLILEMNHPLSGFIKVSSAPMVKALEHLGH